MPSYQPLPASELSRTSIIFCIQDTSIGREAFTGDSMAETESAVSDIAKHKHFDRTIFHVTSGKCELHKLVSYSAFCAHYSTN